MEISIILAVAQNGIIGKDNALVWRQKEDLKYFKKLTSGNVVIMGRRTYESIGKPLPNRDNIVITKNKQFEAAGCMVVHSLEQAVAVAQQLQKEVFIIGGAEIYRQAIPFIQKVYLTRVLGQPEGDASFDLKILQDFTCVSSTFMSHNEDNEYDVYFEELVKKAN